ncbi:MAG: hypothetical protein K2X38_22215 [Gemmataceae bacterium]|nr:hypothetical protein [Gemmataceae bacterium]
MFDAPKLLFLSVAELAAIDPVVQNVGLSDGLPGGVGPPFAPIQNAVDGIAGKVAAECDRLAPLFRKAPSEFDHSIGKFKMTVMTTVLQRDLSIRYDPDLIERDDFFRDANNIFLHGILRTRQGTCSNLPVLCIAIGRRLGFPLKLATTAWHLFARWDEPGGERFNIECTSLGFNSYPDSHYMDWPRKVTAEHVRKNRFLRSKTPKEELALYLNNRSCCLRDNGHFAQSANAIAWAAELEPENHMYSGTLCSTMDDWRGSLTSIWPQPFPNLTIHFPPRTFRQVPLDLERNMLHLSTMDKLLKDRKLEERWWSKLRKNELPAGLPKRMIATHETHREFSLSFES